ncbi:serine hydrolase, partial [Phenylobacterium sp.]|uniref:serine hydrolase n=1 Tax=Phenylobacterium sp. TaxID=1871053 RepID=UPI0028114E23
MTRLEKPSPPNASLCRRSVLAAGAAVWLVGCGPGEPLTASDTPRLDMDGLNEAMAEIAARARPGALGVGLTNLESGEVFTFAGERRFPMQSVFKMLLGAAVLAEVDARRLTLDEEFVLTEEMLSPPFSPISAAWPGRRDYTTRDFLAAAVSMSDNTAADVLMKRIGGPGAVTAWLDARRILEVRVDRYERELQTEAHGLPSFRPEWRTE